MPEHLTDVVVKRLPSPSKGNRITYDAGLPKGFGVCVTAKGHKSFVLNYYTRAGRQRRFTIGAYPSWSVAAARTEARRLRTEIDRGGDPLGEIEQSRAAPTVRDLADRFLADYVPRKRISTQRDYRRQIAVNILPELGDLKVAAVGFGDVDRLHRAMSKRAPTQANRTIAVLSRMFTLAIRWGMRADNPCKTIERNVEGKRQRYLTGAELARLTTALTELPDQGAANAIRLLLLTGARRGEVLAAKWTDFDLEEGSWVKPASTTKQKKTHRVPLSDAAVALLKDMRGSAPKEVVHLFPPPEGQTPHRLDLDDAWGILRKTADIGTARLHDLRHTFASVLASAGQSLPMIGSLLGHSSPTTTHRYAHLYDDPQRAAVERAADIITGKPSAKVVPLK